MKTTRHNSGVTLIELLLVLAIIAVLAALSLPAISRSKRIVDHVISWSYGLTDARIEAALKLDEPDDPERRFWSNDQDFEYWVTTTIPKR